MLKAEAPCRTFGGAMVLVVKLEVELSGPKGENAVVGWTVGEVLNCELGWCDV